MTGERRKSSDGDDHQRESIRIAIICSMKDKNARDLIDTLVPVEGVEVVVVTGARNYEAFSGLDQRYIYHGRPVFNLLKPLMAVRPWRHGQFSDILDEIDPDVVLMLGAGRLLFMPALAGFEPTVFLPQGGETDSVTGKFQKGWFDELKHRGYRFVFSQFLDHVAEVWTQAHARPFYESFGLPPERFVDFDWGPVDTDMFTPSVDPVQYVEDPETLVVGTFRRMRKLDMVGPSYETILDGVARLIDRGRDTHLVVGGYGFTENDVEAFVDERIETLGLESNVTRVETVPKSELPGYYAGLDVYLNPTFAGSKVGGIGTGSKEGMACGCAFLTMNDPSMEYLIDHRENGLLIDHGDDEAFARELERLYENPAELAALSAAARETVIKRFSKPVVGDRIKQRFQKLVSGT